MIPFRAIALTPWRSLRPDSWPNSRPEKEALGVFDVIKRYKLVEVGEEILMRANGDAIQDVTAMGDECHRYARIDASVAVAKQKIALMAKGTCGKLFAERMDEIIKNCGRYS